MYDILYLVNPPLNDNLDLSRLDIDLEREGGIIIIFRSVQRFDLELKGQTFYLDYYAWIIFSVFLIYVN